MKSRWLSIFVVLALAVVGLTANVALAQTTGDIDGTVTDSNNAPLPGASVDDRVAGPAGHPHGRHGRRGPLPLPGAAGRHLHGHGGPLGLHEGREDATSRVAHRRDGVGPGARCRSPSRKRSSSRVKRPSSTPPRRRSASRAPRSTISRLPLARNFTSVATTAPGTGTDNSGGITFYGATGLENQYIIDGVNTTGIKIGNQGKTLTNEFVQEVEVKTGGYEAEYRPRPRRHDQRRDEVGRQRVPRRRVRLLRQRQPGLERRPLGRPHGRRACPSSSSPRATTSARTSAATS